MVFVLIGSFIYFIFDLLSNHFCERFCSRKAGYNCNKCRNWRCSYHYCNRKRLNMSIKEYQIYLRNNSDT